MQQSGFQSLVAGRISILVLIAGVVIEIFNRSVSRLGNRKNTQEFDKLIKPHLKKDRADYLFFLISLKLEFIITPWNYIMMLF